MATATRERLEEDIKHCVQRAISEHIAELAQFNCPDDAECIARNRHVLACCVVSDVLRDFRIIRRKKPGGGA